MQLNTVCVMYITILLSCVNCFLQKSSPSRIVIVSSALYKRAHLNWEDMAQPMNYDPQKAYAVSKLSNILHCRELSKQLEGIN